MSLLLAEGVPPHVVRQIVGHSAIDVTMTIYARASIDAKRTALDRLGERLAGAGRGHIGRSETPGKAKPQTRHVA